MKSHEISVSAPGRICLFGEHQDYFGLPIIAAAINLRIFIRGTRRNDLIIKVSLPDIGEQEEFSLEGNLDYQKERDYLKSAVNVLRRKGIQFPFGWNCHLHGTIPINAGTSSSSALVIAWLKFLLETAKDKTLNNPETIAELGFLTNVSFDEELKATELRNPLKRFVLANSLQKKDTTGMLGYIKKHVLEGVQIIRKNIKGFSLKEPLGQKEQEEIEALPPDNKRLLKGTLMTRDLTAQGKALFESETFDHQKFGQLLTKQHHVLRDYIQTSTPKIDKMIQEALNAGALGAKINGSGGGGCMFAYAPEKTEQIAEAIEKMGSEVRIIQVDEGVRIEHVPE
jgi:galactokinase